VQEPVGLVEPVGFVHGRVGFVQGRVGLEENTIQLTKDNLTFICIYIFYLNFLFVSNRNENECVLSNGTRRIEVKRKYGNS
jgi:hypothetical protein